MWYRRLLTSAICLISGLVLLGQAEAGIAWKGFSQLCFDGTFKGGSVKEGELSITLSNLVVRAQCFSTQAGESCQPGEGNIGDITVTVAASADPTKEKGVIFANGCVSLDPWDHHFLESGAPNPDHQHICLPSTNKNKIEILNSAYVPQINTTWELTSNGKTIKHGNQTCFWDGYIDPETCLPCTGLDPVPANCKETFICPIDEEIRK